MENKTKGSWLARTITDTIIVCGTLGILFGNLQGGQAVFVLSMIVLIFADRMVKR